MGRVGGRETQEGGDIHICIADSLCYKAETNTIVKQLHSNKDVFLKKKKKKRRDFPGGAVDKTLCSQCRGPGFNPWSGN